jgi:hypothetical protein
MMTALTTPQTPQRKSPAKTCCMFHGHACVQEHADVNIICNALLFHRDGEDGVEVGDASKWASISAPSNDTNCTEDKMHTRECR